MSRFFHDCAPWRTEVWFNFGNWWFPYNLVWKHFISFLSLRTVSVITQAPCGLGTCSSPTTCSSNRKGLRSVLICHHQTFDSQVPSCWQLIINSVDNDWVRDESNYNLWPGSPQSCCCCCCCSGVLLPTAVWLSAWLLCISCCCSWAGQSKKSRERVKQGTAAFFFPFLSGNVADVHFPMRWSMMVPNDCRIHCLAPLLQGNTPLCWYWKCKILVLFGKH